MAVITTSFREALILTACIAMGSISVAITLAAPALAAAIAAMPEPEPKSRTFFPFTISGLSRTNRAKVCPLAHANAQ